jgi:hypothetical protein
MAIDGKVALLSPLGGVRRPTRPSIAVLWPTNYPQSVTSVHAVWPHELQVTGD